MVVKVCYTFSSVSSFAYYKIDSSCSKEDVKSILDSWFNELSSETGLKYSLESFEIITKCLIEL